MILDRLLVRHRLNLLVAIPLVAVALLTVPLVAGRVDVATAAGSVDRTADLARRVGALVEEIQRARLLSVGYLDARMVAGTDLDVQLAVVSDARAQLLRDLDPAAAPDLVRAVQEVGVVVAEGPLVLSRGVSDQEVLKTDSSAIAALIDALQLDRQPVSGTASAWMLSGLGSLLLADEAASRSGALLLVAASNPGARNQAQADAAVAQGVEQQQAAAFNRLAEPTSLALFREATRGKGAQRLAEAAAEVGRAGAGAPQGDVARHVFAAVQWQTTLRQLVEGTIAEDVSAQAKASSASALETAALISVGALILLGGVVTLSVLVGRSVSGPLRRLTDAAVAVADLSQEQLADVSDDDAGPAAVRRLPELSVTSSDELGELAAAFNRVQATTGALLERQVAGRRNVAAMFAGVGRRTSNLVGRQLALIDALESAEEDPQTLYTLYRLDHVSTRLRRYAGSLVVLSGERGTGELDALVSLADAVRAALGSVEDFQRVSLGSLPDVHLVPSATADVVLVLAELIENGVLFSPPDTWVEVGASLTVDGGCLLTVVDHGIGMPVHRLAEENLRLRQRERLDLAPTDVLGLFVVGRVSRRHGLRVRLQATPGGGITARVRFPEHLILAAAPAEMIGVGIGPVVDPVALPALPAWPAADYMPAAPVLPQPVAPVLPQPAAPVLPQPSRPSAPQCIPQPTARPEEADPMPPAAAGLRRRVPGAHLMEIDAAFDDAAGPVGPTGDGLLGLERMPAPQAGAIPGGRHPAGAPDPERTRREVEDLEAAMALLDERTGPAEALAYQGYPAESGPEVDGYAGYPFGDNSSGDRSPAPTPEPQDPAVGTAPPSGAETLTRRVPGATLAALGAALPAAAAVTPDTPLEIDPDETLRAILEVDEAVQRARGQWGDGTEDTDAVGHWGSRGDGGGR